MQLWAPAKINLWFKILGPRADGFHEIETLMVPISLRDRLTFTAIDPGIEFICDDPTLPVGPENLVVRAAEIFFGFVKQPPRIRLGLTKAIPHGAGLGGGSSDAATTLLGLNDFFDAQLSTGELLRLAAQIGSDVPFFISRSAAICRGRGEIVTPAPAPDSLRLLLVKPEFGVPTPAAYKRWKNSRELPDFHYAPQPCCGLQLCNDLERPVFETHLFLGTVKNWLRRQDGVIAALLSGSGSTIFAVLAEDADVDGLTSSLRSELDPKLWTCEAFTNSEHSKPA